MCAVPRAPECECSGVNDATPGITFRETLSGGFHLGASDPVDGRRQGEAARTRLDLHATITIGDVRRFMADPQHVATLDGTIDFEPLGRDLRASRGTFNLFASPDRPGTKRASYELAFATRGTPYFFAGHMDIRDDAGPDAWSDLTTLYATLHEGTDRSGPIVGAGVLALGTDGLARLAASMRVTGADSLGDGALALAAFGRFFLGELWNTYTSPPSGARGAWRRATRGLSSLLGRRPGA